MNIKKLSKNKKSSTKDIIQEGQLLIVISGPSGVGKDAVVNRLKSLEPSISTIITATTRKRRQYEKEGEHYIFLEEDEFLRKIQNKEFLEWAQVYQNKYGVLFKEIKKGFEKNSIILIKTDIQGAATIKQKLPQSVLIFLTPTSINDLENHLEKRKTESNDHVLQRLNEAKKELQKIQIFDYQIENREGMINATLSQLEAIITIERKKFTTTYH